MNTVATHSSRVKARAGARREGAAMDYVVEDVEFLRHGTAPLLARLYVPNGPGPFRSVVELHGGVWTLNDRIHTEPVHRALAAAKIAVAALDFRQGKAGAYPRSVADCHYGIRWIKANAHLLKSRPDALGVCSQSSGAHIAALLAIRPDDPRYASIELPAGLPKTDATFKSLAMFWPVVNPAGRYRYAQQLCAMPNAPDWAQRHIPLHQAYWKTIDAMEEGSPLVAVQRGEVGRLPPAIWIQPKDDPQHIYLDPGGAGAGTDLDKFVAAWRACGGMLDVTYYDAPQYFTTLDPNSAASQAAFAQVVAFFRATIPDPKERQPA
jgi:acetyl esterase